MKVYILTNQPFPNGMASTNRIKCYAKALLKGGIQCDVVVFTRTEIYGKTPKNILNEGLAEGIHYMYIGDTPIRHKNVFIRQINDFKDKLKTLLYLSNNLHEGDILLSYEGKHLCFINLVIGIIHKKKAKFVRDLCELPFGTSKETYKAVKRRKFTFTRQFPKCDGFIAISNELVKIAERYKRPNALVIKIPIMVDFEKYSLPDKSSEASVPYIFHSGTLLEQKDGILGMIEAFGIALHKIPFPIRFISTGTKENSPHRETIERIIEKYKMQNAIVFTGFISENALQEYLAKASLVIINKYNTQQNNYCFSTKLGEYMAASKPVIITNVGEAMNWLTNGKDAYIVEKENNEALAQKIVEAFTNKQMRHTIGQNGYITCKKCFDYRNYSNVIKDFFNKLNTNGN
jgi:glycosyltransferase involved in cell wall biosynthesis